MIPEGSFVKRKAGAPAAHEGFAFQTQSRPPIQLKRNRAAYCAVLFCDTYGTIIRPILQNFKRIYNVIDVVPVNKLQLFEPAK